MSRYNILGVEPNFKLEGTNLEARYTAEFTPDHLDEIARRADEKFAEQLEGQIFERVAHLRGYVRVVRCRDCNHFEDGVCYRPDGDGDYARWVVEPVGFCAWAERKEDGE